MQSKQWRKYIHSVFKKNDGILNLYNGTWTVNDKLACLNRFSDDFLDQHLELIQKVGIKILSEKHPMFDLDPDKRYAANIYGKASKYSQQLRKGITETLVFLSIHGDKLVNCTREKPELTALLTVREVLKDADWKLWASLDVLLPLLAEATPDEFLSNVEKPLRLAPCPFDELFQQEGKGITGGIYMTGLYRALEVLAWSGDYLDRSLLALAELATHDPGGSWSNRPANSIFTILLPWLPQTTASISQRIGAMKGIIRHYPKIAWNTLIQFLPNNHQSSMGTHKPSYRQFIPQDWKKEVPAEEYWEQVREYASMALEIAREDPELLGKLVDNLDNIPQPVFDKILEYLGSPAIDEKTDDFKEPIWSTLNAFVHKHRQFSDAKWALKPEVIDNIEKVSEKLIPDSPEFSTKHLFTNKDFDLYNRNAKHEVQQENLKQQRIKAVRAIHASGGINEILDFAASVENPIKVGHAFSFLADVDTEKQILSDLLLTDETHFQFFIRGYVFGRYQAKKETWLDALEMQTWSTEQKIAFYILLPFEKKIWDRVSAQDSGVQESYWKQINAIPLQTQSSLIDAIDNLLLYGRPHFALNCIYAHHFTMKEFFPERAVKALLDGVNSDEDPHVMDPYHITEMIKLLQEDPATNEEQMIEIEWYYLKLLGNHSSARPVHLERELSTNADAFLEIIQKLYKSENVEEKTPEPDQDRHAIATNVWELFQVWHRPPGTADDGSFSPELLRNWFQVVKDKSKESGHYKVAMIHVGHVLYYTPEDPEDLWIHRAAAELLDERGNESIRNGFTSEVYNSRGVYTVDPSGDGEREFASTWWGKADAVSKKGFPNFAAALRNLAKSFDKEAERVVADFQKERKEQDSGWEDE